MFGKALVLLVASFVGQVDRTVDRSATSVIVHVFVGDSSVTTGAGLTGLTNASSGLVISAIHPGDASATVYSVASSNVETISTLGTYAAPTSGKVRFKEVDSSNMPGVYELHLANGLFSVSSDTTLRLTLKGATNMRVTNYTMQIGSPANMVRINGDATNGNNATLSLKQLNVVNSSGHGIYAESTLAGSHGIYGKGSGAGVGIKGKGGNGTLGVPATAAPGIEGEGGDAFRVGVDTDTGLEWGGPGIRGLAAAKGTPGITGKGKDGGPGLYIFTDGSGPMNSPPIKIAASSTAIAAVDVDLGTNATSFVRLLNGAAGGVRGFDAQGVTNFTDWFIPVPNVGTAAKVTQFDSLVGEKLNVTASTANTVTMGDLAGIYPDDTLNGLVIVCSNFNTAVITDYAGATGRATIRCLQTDGNWLSNPDDQTPDTIQFTALPFELKTSTAGATWDVTTSSKTTTGTFGKAINDAPTTSSIASTVWGNASRTLTSFGSLVSDLTAAGGTITVTSPVQQSGRRVEIVQGDDYSNDDGRAIDFTSSSWPTLTSASVVFQAQATPGTDSFTKAMSVVTATGTKKVRLELTDTETAARTPGTYSFSVVATLSNGNKVTLSRGTMVVLD